MIGFIASISLFLLFTYSALAAAHAECASSSVSNLPRFFVLFRSKEHIHMYLPLDLSKQAPLLSFLFPFPVPVISAFSHGGTNTHFSGEYSLLNGFSRSLSSCQPSTTLSIHHSLNFMNERHSSQTVASAYPGYLFFFLSLNPLSTMSYHTEYAGQNNLDPPSTGYTTYGASLMPNPLITFLFERLDLLAGNLLAMSFDTSTQFIINTRESREVHE